MWIENLHSTVSIRLPNRLHGNFRKIRSNSLSILLFHSMSWVKKKFPVGCPIPSRTRVEQNEQQQYLSRLICYLCKENINNAKQIILFFNIDSRDTWDHSYVEQHQNSVCVILIRETFITKLKKKSKKNFKKSRTINQVKYNTQ